MCNVRTIMVRFSIQCQLIDYLGKSNPAWMEVENRWFLHNTSIGWFYTPALQLFPCVNISIHSVCHTAQADAPQQKTPRSRTGRFERSPNTFLISINLLERIQAMAARWLGKNCNQFFWRTENISGRMENLLMTRSKADNRSKADKSLKPDFYPN